MDMRELGDRMPHALVNRARDITPFYVRDGFVEVRRDHGNCEHLRAIPAHNHDIRIEFMQRVRNFKRGESCGFCHGDVVAAVNHVVERLAHVKTGGTNFGQKPLAVFIKQDRAADNELERNPRMAPENFQQFFLSGVVYAAGDKKADRAFPCFHRKK